MNIDFKKFSGVGMTSDSSREKLVSMLKSEGIKNSDVLRSMSSIPRHIFVDEALSHRAYEDTSLPIGFNQTISQPFIVAKMTQLLLEGDHAQVLEIGTGSGYQTAVLSKLCKKVHSVERIAAFIPKARERLRALRLTNFSLHLSDGYNGLQRFGPYDAIVCTAAPSSVPPELIEQLKLGGRMIIPIGGPSRQELRVLERLESQIKSTIEDDVVFVPLQEGIVS